MSFSSSSQKKQTSSSSCEALTLWRHHHYYWGVRTWLGTATLADLRLNPLSSGRRRNCYHAANCQRCGSKWAVYAVHGWIPPRLFIGIIRLCAADFMMRLKSDPYGRWPLLWDIARLFRSRFRVLNSSVRPNFHGPPNSALHVRCKLILNAKINTTYFATSTQ